MGGARPLGAGFGGGDGRYFASRIVRWTFRHQHQQITAKQKKAFISDVTYMIIVIVLPARSCTAKGRYHDRVHCIDGGARPGDLHNLH